MTKNKFTFKQAKQRIAELESQLASATAECCMNDKPKYNPRVVAVVALAIGFAIGAIVL